MQVEGNKCYNFFLQTSWLFLNHVLGVSGSAWHHGVFSTQNTHTHTKKSSHVFLYELQERYKMGR